MKLKQHEKSKKILLHCHLADSQLPEDTDIFWLNPAAIINVHRKKKSEKSPRHTTLNLTFQNNTLKKLMAITALTLQS